MTVMHEMEVLKSRWDTVDGLPVHSRISVRDVPPDRLPVVLVHGLVVSSLYMVPTAVQLSPDHRVYTPDLPGFGKSPGPDHTLDLPELADFLAAWMRVVGLDRAVLLGNSFGCQVVVECALRHPERIERAVLQGPTVDPKHRSVPQQVGRWLLASMREPLPLGFIMLRDYLAAGTRRAVRTLQISIADRMEEKLPNVRVPVLVVRGTYDSLVPQRWAEEATGLLPDGRLAVIPGGTHTANYSSPLELARLTRTFIAEGRREEERQTA